MVAMLDVSETTWSLEAFWRILTLYLSHITIISQTLVFDGAPFSNKLGLLSFLYIMVVVRRGGYCSFRSVCAKNFRDGSVSPM